jgi:hypothetical protein
MIEYRAYSRIADTLLELRARVVPGGLAGQDTTLQPQMRADVRFLRRYGAGKFYLVKPVLRNRTIFLFHVF